MLNRMGWLLFTVLAAVNLLVLIWLTQTLNAEPESAPILDTSRPGQIVLPPVLIQNVIAEKSTEDVQLELKGDRLAIKHQSSFMGLNIKTNILTAPSVISDNKLRLKITDINIAGLKLSDEQQLKLIKEFAHLPEGIELDVKNKCFYYQLEPVKVAGRQLTLTDIDSEGWHFDLD
ncbi:DUF2140 family protein [Macrococcus carouselicus]|uniref:DUF2140 family protein n=1 Tax=Macrococcus carouselicus TaxID=69969 RepID=A0A9Q8CMQ5_9STAP|nr:DUF2140 family protein [Macrococcus carouselicus]TDM04231.1 DUF2140 family protein [Macrococcus carouselicus]